MPYRAECGVYCITNTANNKQYIGSSVNVRSRWSEHRYYLRLGKHKNSFIQDDCNVYGADIFVFEILELVDRDRLLEREQFYISSLKPAYNVFTAMTNRKRLVPRTETSIQKMSTTRKGMKPSLEARAKMSAVRKGRKFTEEHKANLRAANSTPEARQRSREASAQRVFTEESKQKLIQANIDAWSKPESATRREKIRQLGLANKGRKASPETKARQSEAQKRRHA